MADVLRTDGHRFASLKPPSGEIKALRALVRTRADLGRAQMELHLDCEREEDGLWLAEVPELPGVLAYGPTAAEAMAKAEVVAFRVVAERIEQGESGPQAIRFVVPAA